MNTITISAVYRHGVLEPDRPLNLSENAVVIIQITTEGEVQAEYDAGLGAFPELAALTDEDIEEATKLWDHSLDKRIHLSNSE